MPKRGIRAGPTSGGDAKMALKIRRIVADGDMDGLIAAAVLRNKWPDAEVIWSHPAEIRAGLLDAVIGLDTAVLDLPFHAACGLWIDHHQTNRPTAEIRQTHENKGGVIHWSERDSAARVAFEAFSSEVDLSGFDAWLPMLDALDGGKVSLSDFLSDDPIVWISRTVSKTEPEYCQLLLDSVVGGLSPTEVAALPEVAMKIADKRVITERTRQLISSKSEVLDRLAVVRLDEEGARTNGYLVTAHFGDAVDACCIVHGYADGSLTNADRWPISASFYTNSFLHHDGGIFDLTKLAQSFDIDGGGHADACGCRIQPIPTGTTVRDGPSAVEKRVLTAEDVQRNLQAWLTEWATR
jgi:hypothetical protein